MRTRDLLLAAAAATTLLASPALAQDPAKPADPKPAQTQPAQPAKPKPADSLEAMIETALKHNPEIQAAQARVREAEIQLNKIKSEVMLQVTAQRQLLQNAKEVLRLMEEEHKRRLGLEAQKLTTNAGVGQSQIELLRARSEIAKLEAEQTKLIGRVPGKPEQPVTTSVTPLWTYYTTDLGQQWLVSPNNTLQPYINPSLNRNAIFGDPVRSWDLTYVWPAQPTQPASTTTASIADRLRQAMQKSVKIDKEFYGTATKALDFLKERGLKDVPVRTLAGQNNLFETGVELMAGELPMSAWLALIQDSVPELRFVVREYGLLVTTNDRVPPDGMLLGDFVRHAKSQPTKASEPKKDEAKKEEKPKQ